MTFARAPVNRALILFTRASTSGKKSQQIFVTSIVSRYGLYLVKRICFQHFYEQFGSIIVSDKLVFSSMISCDFVINLPSRKRKFVV